MGVEKDGASLGSQHSNGMNGISSSSLSDYRLETAMFRRMVNVAVAIEEVSEHNGTAPRSVGSITIDDSATLAQSFRFTWRGRKYSKRRRSNVAVIIDRIVFI